MNDLNDLELQLRTWVPRRPSARLKRRLFRRSSPDREPARSFRLSWLPPAIAALMLLCVLFNQHSSQALSSPGSNSMIAFALSNQNAAAYLSGTFSREHNGVPTGTFEWTNGSGSTSGIGSHSVSSGTNE